MSNSPPPFTFARRNYQKPNKPSADLLGNPSSHQSQRPFLTGISSGEEEAEEREMEGGFAEPSKRPTGFQARADEYRLAPQPNNPRAGSQQHHRPPLQPGYQLAGISLPSSPPSSKPVLASKPARISSIVTFNNEYSNSLPKVSQSRSSKDFGSSPAAISNASEKLQEAVHGESQRHRSQASSLSLKAGKGVLLSPVSASKDPFAMMLDNARFNQGRVKELEALVERLQYDLDLLAQSKTSDLEREKNAMIEKFEILKTGMEARLQAAKENEAVALNDLSAARTEIELQSREHSLGRVSGMTSSDFLAYDAVVEKEAENARKSSDAQKAMEEKVSALSTEGDTLEAMITTLQEEVTSKSNALAVQISRGDSLEKRSDAALSEGPKGREQLRCAAKLVGPFPLLVFPKLMGDSSEKAEIDTLNIDLVSVKQALVQCRDELATREEGLRAARAANDKLKESLIALKEANTSLTVGQKLIHELLEEKKANLKLVVDTCQFHEVTIRNMEKNLEDMKTELKEAANIPLLKESLRIAIAGMEGAGQTGKDGHMSQDKAASMQNTLRECSERESSEMDEKVREIASLREQLVTVANSAAVSLQFEISGRVTAHESQNITELEEELAALRAELVDREAAASNLANANAKLEKALEDPIKSCLNRISEDQLTRVDRDRSNEEIGNLTNELTKTNASKSKHIKASEEKLKMLENEIRQLHESLSDRERTVMDRDQEILELEHLNAELQAKSAGHEPECPSSPLTEPSSHERLPAVGSMFDYGGRSPFTSDPTVFGYPAVGNDLGFGTGTQGDDRQQLSQPMPPATQNRKGETRKPDFESPSANEIDEIQQSEDDEDGTVQVHTQKSSKRSRKSAPQSDTKSLHPTDQRGESKRKDISSRSGDSQTAKKARTGAVDKKRGRA
ncbi:hypothetical protein P7C73_g537, partial [Tremellales sp. Uapishka_1]